MLENRYGHFDEHGRLFTVTDWRTPTPWTNIVSNGRYGFIVSHNGAGFSWLDNSQLNVLTRWDMDLVRDDKGRFLLVADLDSNEVWSLSPAPCWPKYDDYRCEHRPGSTTFITAAQGVRAVWTLGVAPDDPVEIWSLRITNESGRPRRLRLSSYLEWCCGVAPDSKREFHKLFITTRHDTKRRAVVVTKNMWDVPSKDERHHWNQNWPYAAAHAVCGAKFEKDLAVADKAAFLGRYGRPEAPAAFRGSAKHGVGFGRFGDDIAALGGDITLAPGASFDAHFLLAIDTDERKVEALLDKYADPRAAQRALRAGAERWHDMLSRTQVETDAPDFDTLNNTWLPYQAIAGRLWARTGYYQQSGAFGFRDQLQDSQVWLPIDPRRCRDQIRVHAAHQFADGSVYHWWHPLSEAGSHTACSDDYLWLPFVVASYIRETGDFSILDDTARFVDEEKATTILDHCRRSFARCFARHGALGLPLIGSCDWNDGLSSLGVGEKGESVWLAMFLANLLREWRPIWQRLGDDESAAEFAGRRSSLIESIRAHAWDGAWFRRATKDTGEWVGSSSNKEGRIFLNAQTWAIIADAADRERTERAWASVREHLIADMGPLLLAPAYTEPDGTVGYITRYSPGSRENGGVYMHAATWALMAACRQRDTDAVQRIWKSISPPARAARDPDLYAAEPYVTPGNVDGPLSDTPGRAGWTWYTGSAAWLNRVSLEWVLGVRPTWEGLLIDPAPFPELGRVTVRRVWRGRTITVRFDARDYAASAGAHAAVTLNGRPLAGALLRESDLTEGADAEIEVSWGVPKVEVKPATVAGAARENVR